MGLRTTLANTFKRPARHEQKRQIKPFMRQQLCVVVAELAEDLRHGLAHHSGQHVQAACQA
jgi:hypothetical protein